MHRSKTLYKKDTIFSTMELTIYTTNCSVWPSIWSVIFKVKKKVTTEKGQIDSYCLSALENVSRVEMVVENYVQVKGAMSTMAQ